ARVIVNDLREQARSHIFWTVPALAFDLAFFNTQAGREAAVLLILILILGAPLNHAGRTQALERG
ncbi:hypothetical protein, partial [Pseudomonas yamanorum]|uniref:hypothetical protein n=1 Tax=Pseudomonas yamanorum TaxID=515393 RepID=UPI003B9ED914